MTLLSNLKVLDFSTLLPGPFATLLLSDLGADVLRIEKKSNEQSWVVDDYLHRSKRSLALDLKKAEAIRQVKELVGEYDILLEQFRPGVMERLGLGYEELRAVNPRLIYCSLTGYGQTGDYRDRAGHDINYLAISGLSSHSGTTEGGPALNGTQIADLAGGSLHSVIAILSAVIYRERTGEGQHLDISMTDCSFTLNALTAPFYFGHNHEPKPEQTMLNGGTFYGHYKTKDSRYFSVGSLEPQFRKKLCQAIGREDLIEQSFSQSPEDVQAFKAELKQVFSEKTFAQWQSIFSNTDACVEPVLTLSEACSHPQLVEREMVVEVPTLTGESQKQIACPIKSSVFQPVYRYAGVK